MKSFSERNSYVIGAVGIGVCALAAVVALNYQSLPFVNDTNDYSAYFANAGGLTTGATVQVSGVDVGKVESMALDGTQVLMTFSIEKNIHLGDRTEASVKTKSLLGAKFLEVSPRGAGNLRDAIPLDRTTSAYQLPDALGDVTTAISGLNTDQLSQSISVVADTFKDTPPMLRSAVANLARFSDSLDQRDAQLRNLLTNARKATGVLAERSDQVVGLVADTNALLIQLRTQSAALDEISGSISAVTEQIKGFIGDNRQTLRPALDKLNGALTIVDNRKEQVQQSIKKLNAYAMSLGESVSAGPFFKAYLSNLLPGQFVQPFVDAAFSDLGLDPATLLPSQLHDPQTGQPGTPALPMPYPRTGQGGEPRMTLPDAITGKPDDPRYPYREPLPAPPPGGPPPGPPALAPGEEATAPAPAPQPVFQLAPGEAPSPTQPTPGADVDGHLAPAAPSPVVVGERQQ
jgi:phospholipid/cholesterol/gamma-HCH transport system substrate-binding protein